MVFHSLNFKIFRTSRTHNVKEQSEDRGTEGQRDRGTVTCCPKLPVVQVRPVPMISGGSWPRPEPGWLQRWGDGCGGRRGAGPGAV